jgi:hypothetical protein
MVGHWLRLSLLQNSGTGIQDFFADAAKDAIRQAPIYSALPD